jgi:hypothetical protein
MSVEQGDYHQLSQYEIAGRLLYCVVKDVRQYPVQTVLGCHQQNSLSDYSTNRPYWTNLILGHLQMRTC